MKRLGFTAGASDGAEDPYFAQYRDLGVVKEEQFDECVLLFSLVVLCVLS